MKKLLPFLLAGVIAEVPPLLAEMMQPHAGRGDGFGVFGALSLFYGLLHFPVYALVLLLRVPESYQALLIYPLGSLYLASLFWLFIRFFVAPYRTGGTNKPPPADIDDRNRNQ